jgi:hypothetical protein
MNSEAEHTQAAEVASATSNGAAVTITNNSPPARGRRVKFTPQVIEQIKESVAAGISRDEIANRVGVTVGSLQVTCSRLGISLRRIILPNGSGRHMSDVRERTIPTPCCSAHVREQKEVSQPTARAAPSANFAITMRHRGKEQTSNIELPSCAIGVLASEAISRDLDMPRLIGQILVAAINKDMIQGILR